MIFTLKHWTSWQCLPPRRAILGAASILIGFVCTPLQAEITFDGLSAKQSFQLRSALQLAEQRLDRKATCSNLFDDLQGSGIDLLRGATYEGARKDEVQRWCKNGGVALFTTVRGNRVGVCREMLRKLDRFALARVLIHEALHLGGMEESPAMEGAPSSTELNRLVQNRCSL